MYLHIYWKTVNLTYALANGQIPRKNKLEYEITYSLGKTRGQKNLISFSEENRLGLRAFRILIKPSV